MMGYSSAGIAEAVDLNSNGSNSEDSKVMDVSMSSWTSETEMGIIPRLTNAIFDGIAKSEGLEFTIQVSYVEIYMEKVRDLLSPSHDNLKIRENKTRGVYIEAVTEVYVRAYSEVIQIMKEGEKNRSVAATKMNKKSSRSHSVFILTVTQRNVKTNAKKTSKLVLVDLAGSEKVRKTGAAGLTLKQAQHTNKSLAALGNVINSLTESRPHIPYRDSKLTRLLTDSLGGNSKTCLITTCSPSEYNLVETYTTLRFGSRAKSIKNKPKVNRERTVAEYKILLREARQKISDQTLVIAALEKDLEAVVLLASEGGVDLSSIDFLPKSKIDEATNYLMSPVKQGAKGDISFPPLERDEFGNAATPSRPTASGAGAEKEDGVPISFVETDSDELDDSDADSELVVSDSEEEVDEELKRRKRLPTGGRSTEISIAVEKLQKKLKKYRHELVESHEMQEDLADEILQKDCELEQKAHELDLTQAKLSRALSQISLLESEMKELKESVAGHILEHKTSELRHTEDSLTIKELQSSNEELLERNNALLQRLRSSGVDTGSSLSLNSALDESDSESSRASPTNPNQQQQQQQQNGGKGQEAQTSDTATAEELAAFKKRYDSLAKKYEIKCAEAVALVLENEDLKEGSATQGSAVDPSVAEDLSSVPAHRRSASYERLAQDLQRKCDSNMRLQDQVNELKYEIENMKDQNGRLEKQVTSLRLNNSQLVSQVGGQLTLSAVSAESLDNADNDNQLHAHFLKLRAAVEKLRAKNEQLRRQVEYQGKMLDTKVEHIEVLEMALRDSNSMHREQGHQHNVVVERLENEITQLRQLLEEEREKASGKSVSEAGSGAETPGKDGTAANIVVPLQGQGRSWKSLFFKNKN